MTTRNAMACYLKKELIGFIVKQKTGFQWYSIHESDECWESGHASTLSIAQYDLEVAEKAYRDQIAFMAAMDAGDDD